MRPGRRTFFSRRRLLLAAVWILALLVAGWATLRYLVAPWALGRALASAGIQPASFQIESMGVAGTRITHLSLGATPWLTAGRLNVSYSLADLIAGRVNTIILSDATWTVRVQDGSIDWGPSGAGSGGPLNLDLPLGRLEVNASTIRVIVNGHSYDLPMTLALTSSGAEGVQARLRLTGLGGAIEVDAHVASDAGAVTIDLGLSNPVSLASQEGGISGSLESASARLRIGGDDGIGGTLTFRKGSLRAGDAEVTDVEAGITIRSRRQAEMTGLKAVIGDGGTITASPFVIDTDEPVVRTRLDLANLSLAEWLPLLSHQHATGEGRLSGSVDLAFDLATLKLVDLRGSLIADPSHGFIQVTDAEALGALLDAQDPRFTTDEVMRPVRDKVVAAFRDFAYHKLTLDLSRREDHTVAQAHVSGFGRHGEDPQGLNLTLDLHVHDALIDLVPRLASLGKVKGAAGSALDRFFGAPATGDAAR